MRDLKKYGTEKDWWGMTKDHRLWWRVTGEGAEELKGI